jgi:hypothetical protein
MVIWNLLDGGPLNIIIYIASWPSHIDSIIASMTWQHRR